MRQRCGGGGAASAAAQRHAQQPAAPALAAKRPRRRFSEATGLRPAARRLLPGDEDEALAGTTLADSPASSTLGLRGEGMVAPSEQSVRAQT